jgi:hypothetical protein
MTPQGRLKIHVATELTIHAGYYWTICHNVVPGRRAVVFRDRKKADCKHCRKKLRLK